MNKPTDIKESPGYLRMSLAAAMTLGFKGGRFYRGARLTCINLLVTYQEGCRANCSYCGLSRHGDGGYPERNFIRVKWPEYHLDDIIQRIKERKDKVDRVCLSMVTNPRSVTDCETIGKKLHDQLPDIPISFLISPTILNRDNLLRFKEVGVERIGIAVDAATPGLFDRHRGKEVRGPHRWDKYWRCFEDAVEIFGQRMVGSHLIVGIGETEKEMVQAFQKTRDLGGVTHLFSFFPEGGSILEEHKQPPAGQYRRMQLCRYLLDEGISSFQNMSFDEQGRVVDFGISEEQKDEIINRGIPFMTSGCPCNETGRVACNRPFGDSEPGENIRSFPFPPNSEDLEKIRNELSE